MISITCSTIGPITCTRVDSTSVTLAQWESRLVRAYYTAGNPGSGQLKLRAVSEGARDSGHYNVTVVTPNGSPVVSLAPHHRTVLDYGKCAAQCFHTVYRYATPAYFSLDQPRSFGLTYSSATARPTPVVELDVTPPSSGTATRYKVQLYRASNSTLITLLNGSTEAYFAATPGQKTRLAAAFEARQNNLATSAHQINVVVTAYFASGDPTTSTISTRVIVVDRSVTHYGAGVWPTGAQQYVWTDGGPLIIESDGTAYHYENLVTPAGETSRLSSVSGGLRRTYLDGSYVDFDGASGMMVRAADRFGNTTTYTWAVNKLTAITDPMGKTIQVAYTTPGYIWYAEDPGGRRAYFNVDGLLHWDSIHEDVQGSTPTYRTVLQYDTADRLTSVTSPTGAVSNYAYDALNRLQQITAPAIPLYSGGTGSPIQSMVAPARIVWQPGLAGTDAATAKAAVGSDTVMAVISDPLGATTKFTVDRFGAPLRVVDVLGQTTTISRDSMGRPTSVVEPNGHSMSYTYTSGQSTEHYSHYLLRSIYDNTKGQTTTYTYNASNDIVTMVLTAGTSARWDYSYHTGGPDGPAGALKSVFVSASALPGTTPAATYFYDPRGRMTRSQSADARHKTEYAYDAVWGNRQEETDPQGAKTRRRFDGLGRADSSYAPHGSVTGVQYGPLNQVLASRNALGYLTQYQYNLDLTLKRVVDPKNQIYRLEYNPLGLLTAKYDLADTLRAERYEYDLAGQLRRYTNRRGQQVVMTYDAAGRLKFRGGTGVADDTFDYDSLGHRMVASNGYAFDSLRYDNAGRLEKAFTRLNGTLFQWGYGYDSRGNLNTRSLYRDGAIEGAGSLTRSYNSHNMLTSTIVPGVTVSVQRSGPDSLPVRRVINSGSAGSFWLGRVFDTLTYRPTRDTMSVASLDAKFGGAVGMDSLGRLTSLAEYSIRPPTIYRYDAAGQLLTDCEVQFTSCKTDYGTVSLFTNVYAYDPAGNRIDPLAGPIVGAGNRVTSFKGYTFTYDLDGNVLTKEGNGVSWRYTWDALNRLTEVYKNGPIWATFAYDALGRRIKKSVNGATEWYLYDGDQVVVDLTATMGVRRSYGWYPGTDQLLSVNIPGSWTGVAITDHKLDATLRGIANAANGEWIKSFSRTAWGETVADTGAVIRMRLVGQQYDQETGLYYMRARYYDPMLGRFISEDPMGIAGGTNLYGYAGNDPMNSLDPWGLTEVCLLEDGTYGVKGEDGVCRAHVLPELKGEGPSSQYGDHGGRLRGIPVPDPPPPIVVPTGAATSPSAGHDDGKTNGPTIRKDVTCKVAATTWGAIKGSAWGFGTGLAYGLRVSQPIALANASRVGLAAAAVTIETGGAGGVPAFLSTYAVTTVSVTATYGFRGAVVGGVGGAAKGWAGSLVGFCPDGLQ